MTASKPRTTARTWALASVAIAIAVMALKFWAWALTGSVALFSDAVETIVNVLASSVALVAVEVAGRPADEDHPFGHHKAEYLAAVLEGVLVVGAATLIAVAAVADIAAIRSNEYAKVLTAIPEGLAINLTAATINAAWAYTLLRAAQALRSPALAADARHVRADVITSMGVAGGLVVATTTGILILDPIMALVVAAIVVWQGARLLTASLGGLMDRVVEGAEADAIRDTIQAHMAGAIEAHDVRMREAGSATFVECHLVVPATMSVGAAHRICDRIEAAVEEQHPHATLTIHVEPEGEALGEKEEGVLPPPPTPPPAS